MVLTKPKRLNASRDFSKAKAKVGKRKPVRANDTATQLRFRRIVVPSQSAVRKGSAESQSFDTALHELIFKTRHYSGNERRLALTNIRDRLRKQQCVANHIVVDAVRRLAPLIVDDDRGVRSALLLLYRDIFVHIANSASCEVSSCSPILCEYTIAAATHPSPSIRINSISFIEMCLNVCPETFVFHRARAASAILSLLDERTDTDVLAIGQRSLHQKSSKHTQSRSSILRCLRRIVELRSQPPDVPTTSHCVYDSTALALLHTSQNTVPKVTTKSSANSPLCCTPLIRALVECFVECADKHFVGDLQECVTALVALCSHSESLPHDINALVHSHIFTRFPIESRSVSHTIITLNITICTLITSLLRHRPDQVLLHTAASYLTHTITHITVTTPNFVGMLTNAVVTMLPIVTLQQQKKFVSAIFSLWSTLHEHSRALTHCLSVLRAAIQLPTLQTAMFSLLHSWINLLPTHIIVNASHNTNHENESNENLDVNQHDALKLLIHTCCKHSTLAPQCIRPIFSTNVLHHLPSHLVTSLLYYINVIDTPLLTSIAHCCRCSSLDIKLRSALIGVITLRHTHHQLEDIALINFLLTSAIGQSSDTDDDILDDIIIALTSYHSSIHIEGVISPPIHIEGVISPPIHIEGVIFPSICALVKADKTSDADRRRALKLCRWCWSRRPSLQHVHESLAQHVWRQWMVSRDEICVNMLIDVPAMCHHVLTACGNDSNEGVLLALNELVAQHSLHSVFAGCRANTIKTCKVIAERNDAESHLIEQLHSDCVIIYGHAVLQDLTPQV